ncbi:MAG: 23S rRNA (adenine(2503)-C(2))-methyltransferase RlmN [bacterium]|nr:23S rRNA (adenine(2503)-C(2))-methyltransferase RlmN [bacterium]
MLIGTTQTRPITDLPSDELREAVGRSAPAYRIVQIEDWLFKRGAAAFEEMTDISKELREQLSAVYHIPAPGIAEEARSARDGTTKYLLQLYDGRLVETVYLPGEDHDTLCVSTQVGCAIGCDFCATASLGFGRDLTAYEILMQYVIVLQRHPDRNIRNVVLMGQGEPLLNYENSVAAIGLLQRYHEVGGRRITLSTAGAVPGIRRLADEGVRCKLAVSLNSAKQGTREKIMPIARKYDLKELTAALQYYYEKQNRRPTLEYTLIKGVNDSIDSARALVNFSKRVPCKINIIPFNPWPGSTYEAPDEDAVTSFMEVAATSPMALTFRAPRGTDIAAACGTLARRKITEDD